MPAHEGVLPKSALLVALPPAWLSVAIRNLSRSRRNCSPVCSGASPLVQSARVLSRPASSCLVSLRSPTGRRPDRVGSMKSSS